MSIEQVFQHICQVIVNGRTLAKNLANRGIVIGWLAEDQGESLSAQWFKRVLTEQPSLADQVAWEVVVSPEQRKANESRQLEQDKQAFAALARQYGLSECEANLNLYHHTHSIEGMALATPEELEAYRLEAVEQYNATLLSATPDQLRAAVRRESTERAIAAQNEQAARELEASRLRNLQMSSYPLLPADITSDKIKCATPDQIRLWVKKYSDYQVTTRLRGEN